MKLHSGLRNLKAIGNHPHHYIRLTSIWQKRSFVERHFHCLHLPASVCVHAYCAKLSSLYHHLPPCAPFMIPSLARDLEMPSLCENLRPRRLLLICTHSDLMLTQINSHPKMVWRHNAAFCGPVSQKRPSGPFLKCLPPSTANVVERLERVF